MAIIRDEKSFSPITAEKTTLSLDIWRFNFGWIETRRTVSSDTLDSSAPSDGILKEEVEVGVSGDGIIYYEKTVVLAHPSGFLSPAPPLTVPAVLPTYRKQGTTHRTSTTVSLDGSKPLLHDVGIVSFDIAENKAYAKISNAKNGQVFTDSGQQMISPVGPVDSSVTIISANGVTTNTHSKG